jgi:L-cystine transport system permease protein
MAFDVQFAIKSFPKILAGVPMTVFITIFSITIGLFIGLLIAICRINKIPVLKSVAAVYVSFIRGTPVLIQLYIVFYGLPEFLTYLHQSRGLNVSPNGLPHITVALIAFSMNASAYLSENIRSALNSVDKGQVEAAYSVGMTSSQSLRRIVIPQALVAALPNFSNVFLEITKDTSLAFSVMIVEIMANATIQASSGYKYLETYVDAAIIYFIVCYIFGKVFVILENRLKRYKEVSLLLKN